MLYRKIHYVWKNLGTAVGLRKSEQAIDAAGKPREALISGCMHGVYAQQGAHDFFKFSMCDNIDLINSSY